MILTELALSASRNEQASCLTIRQIATLGVLAEARTPVDFGAVAQTLGIPSKGALTRICDKLAAAGLIRRTRNAEDGRRAWLAIAPTGLALLAELNAPATKGGAR